MNKGMVGYIVVFLLLIIGTTIWASYDSITPAVAQAQAEISVGAAPVQVMQKGASWILKLLAGATFTGIAAAAFSEVKKAYRAWQRNSEMKRWTSGPNAQWRQQQNTTSMPRLKREDLMLLALMQGRVPSQAMRPNSIQRDQADDDIPLEF